MKNRPVHFLKNLSGLTVWAGIFLSVLLFSCGRKALPVPPDAYVPPPVKNLKATVEAGKVTLSWIIPNGVAQRKKGLDRVVVFKAGLAGACPDCPLSYKPMATIPAWEMAENGRGDLQGKYALQIEKGRFAFYVVAYSRAGMAGPKSDIVNTPLSTEER